MAASPGSHKFAGMKFFVPSMLLSAAMLLSAPSLTRGATIVGWETSTLTASTSPTAATQSETGIDSGTLSVVGMNPAANAGATGGTSIWGYGATSYGDTLADSIADGDYFSVVITPEAGNTIDFDNVNFWASIRNFSNVNNMALLSSATQSSPGVWAEGDALFTTSSIGNQTNFDVALTDSRLNDITSPIEFRFYTFGTQDFKAIGFGTYNIANDGTQVPTLDLSFNGTVSVIPEPSTAGLVALGLLPVALRRRRKSQSGL